MNDKHNKINPLKLIITSCLLLVLSACSNDNKTNTISTTETVTELPGFIQNIAELTDETGGELKAYISTDGGNTFEEMLVDRQAGSSSISLNLKRQTYIVVVKFEYTDGTNTVLLAASRKTSIDLSNGDSRLDLLDSDYDNGNDEKQRRENGEFIAGDYDVDRDGMSNLEEVKEGTNPIVFTIPEKTIINLTIRPDNTTITLGQGTITLDAIVTFEDNSTSNFTELVNWSSNNADVATVSPNTGVVTGLGIGQAEITATLNDSSVTPATAQLEVVPVANEACKLDGTSRLDNCKLE